jgi:hypothetical protein
MPTNHYVMATNHYVMAKTKRFKKTSTARKTYLT